MKTVQCVKDCLAKTKSIVVDGKSYQVPFLQIDPEGVSPSDVLSKLEGAEICCSCFCKDEEGDNFLVLKLAGGGYLACWKLHVALCANEEELNGYLNVEERAMHRYGHKD